MYHGDERHVNRKSCIVEKFIIIRYATVYYPMTLQDFIHRKKAVVEEAPYYTDLSF